MSSKTTLDKMSESVLYCRTERHDTPTWHDSDLEFRRGVLVAFTRTHTCQRCTWQKKQVLVWDGYGYEVDYRATRAKYPNGYLNEQGRLRLAQVRVEQMVRAGHPVPTPKRRKR